jgi:hypothetical protein
MALGAEGMGDMTQDRLHDATQDQDRLQDRDQTQDRVYGWQLMTEEERVAHRAKMRSMTTAQEREQYRLEHHKKMQERARERGVTLPEEPGPVGKGMQGGGMGPGGGMGSGGMGSGR